MLYASPDDMAALYDEVVLVQITNYNNRLAEAINEPLLQTACEAGSRLVDGYLMPLGIKPTDFSPDFSEVLKTHAARLVMDFLAGTDPQVREQAKETTDWLKSLPRLSRDALENLVIRPPEPGEPPIEPPAPVRGPVVFEEGYRWRVTL